MSRRILAASTVFFLLCFTGAMPATNATNDPDTPLEVRLKVVTQSVCKKSGLLLIAQIKNVSNRPLVIDANGLWYQMTFARGVSGSGGSAGSIYTLNNEAGPRYKGKYMLLGSGALYKASRKVNLQDSMFDKPGQIELTTSYGQFMDVLFAGKRVWRGSAESNKTSFEIASCN